MSSTQPLMRRPLPASARRLLWLSVLLYAGYLVGGNIFLNTVANRTLSPSPKSFQVRWAWAFTLWPGHIYAHDMVMRGHSHNLLWQAEGSASGRVMLWPLFRRNIHFGHIYASDVKLAGWHTDDDRQPPPWRPDAWHVSAEAVTTHSLRRLRMFDLIATSKRGGNARIGFTHQLRGGATQILPSRLEMPDALVRVRKHTLVHDARLDLRFASDPFTHADPPRWQKLGRARVSLSLAGTTAPLALGANERGATAVAKQSGGKLSADFTLDHGVLVPGGRLQWCTEVALTAADGSQQRRPGRLDLIVGHEQITLRASVPPPVAASKTEQTNHLDADFHFASRRLIPHRSAKATLALLSGEIKGRWHFASLRWLTPLTATKPWLQIDGAGNVAGELRMKSGALVPGSHVEIPEVSLAVGLLDNVFSGDGQAAAQVVAAPHGNNTRVTVVLPDFTLAPRAARHQPYLRGHDLHMYLHSSADLLDLRDSFSGRLHFANAEIPDLRAYNRYLPGKSLQFLHGHGQLSTDLTVDGKGDVDSGHLSMQSTGARLALGVSRLTGDLQLDTSLQGAKRTGHAYDLSDFGLGLKGVRVEGSSAPPWWGTVTLQHGRLDWDQPMRLHGDATLVMKDVSLLLSLFADRSAFPKWIANVINDGKATAHAQIVVQKHDFILDHLVAHNKRVDLYAHLRIRNGEPVGDLYARWGILGLGVALKGGKRDFHLLHAKRWYESQPDLLPTSK